MGNPGPMTPIRLGASGFSRTSTPSGVDSFGQLFSTYILVGRPYSQLDLQPLPEPRFDPSVRDCQTDQPRNRKGDPGKRDWPAEVDSREVGDAEHGEREDEFDSKRRRCVSGPQYGHEPHVAGDRHQHRPRNTAEAGAG